MNSQLIGAWEGGREGTGGIMVFTKTHFCAIEVENHRKQFREQQPSEAEEAAAFRTLLAGGGTYTVSGSSLTITETCDRLPRTPVSSTYEITLEGDTLTLKLASMNLTRILRKVS